MDTSLRPPSTTLRGSVLSPLRRASSTRALLAYGVGLGILCLGLIAVLMAAGERLHGPVWQLAILAAVAVVAERQPVRVAPNTEITFALLPMLFAALVY